MRLLAPTPGTAMDTRRSSAGRWFGVLAGASVGAVAARGAAAWAAPCGDRVAGATAGGAGLVHVTSNRHPSAGMSVWEPIAQRIRVLLVANGGATTRLPCAVQGADPAG